MEKKNNVLLWISIGLGVLAILSRIWITIPNFSPILGVGVFATYALGKRVGIGITLASIVVSDIVLALTQTWTSFWGFMSFQPVVYGALILVMLVGYLINKKAKAHTVLGSAIVGSLLFFIVTNFFVWLDFYGWGMYTKDFTGLVQCYIAAIPFFKWSILSDIIFSMSLFGVWNLAGHGVNKLVKETPT